MIGRLCRIRRPTLSQWSFRQCWQYLLERSLPQFNILRSLDYYFQLLICRFQFITYEEVAVCIKDVPIKVVWMLCYTWPFGCHTLGLACHKTSCKTAPKPTHPNLFFIFYVWRCLLSRNLFSGIKARASYSLVPST